MSYKDGSSYTLTNGQKSIYSGSSSELRDHDLSPAKNPPAFLLGGSDSQCKECGKHVYEMEKTTADEIIYHKSCFRCTQCKKLLNASTFTSIGGILYCKPHFMELFKPKGQCKDMDDEESERDLDEEENMKTPALPAVKDMKGLFETHSQAVGSLSSQASNNYSNYQKQASKWEKPTMESSLTPVNRVADDDDDDSDEDSDILPPADITRNLVAKFRLLEKGDGSDVPILPKPPVRQFTPPRESPERSIPDIARKSADVIGDVIRCEDPAELEDELPETGMARALVEQWKSLQVEVEKPRPPTGSMSITSSRSPVTGGKVGMSDANPGGQTVAAGMEARSEETGYSGMDETPEDDLPPQDITRNLLAKFKTIAVDQQPASSQTSSKKQFRWDVKEAKPINYPGLVTVSKTPHIGDRPDQDKDSGEEEDEESYEDDDGDEPQPAYAKIMLQKFRSMEKS